jgi:outer membrane protein assembly factor BamB
MSASPILSEGKLYAGNEEGKFYVFEAGRQFKVLAENSFPDGFMASPAVSGNSLYLRSKTTLYRFDP